MSDTDKIFVEVSEQYIKSTSNAHFIYYNYGLHGLNTSLKYNKIVRDYIIVQKHFYKWKL